MPDDSSAIAQLLTQVVTVAPGVAFVVKIAVDLFKFSRPPSWLLPLAALVLGWSITLAVYLALGRPLTLQLGAFVFLVGIAAASGAVISTETHKAARRPDDGAVAELGPVLVQAEEDRMAAQSPGVYATPADSLYLPIDDATTNTTPPQPSGRSALPPMGPHRPVPTSLLRRTREPRS